MQEMETTLSFYFHLLDANERKKTGMSKADAM